MDFTGRNGQRVAVTSLFAVLIPLLVLDLQFKFAVPIMDVLMRPSLLNLLYELVIYAVVIYVVHQHKSLVNLVQAAGLCLVYRLLLGGVLTLAMGVLYGMNLEVWVKYAMSSYLPAIVLQMIAALWALSPMIKQIGQASGQHAKRPMSPSADSAQGSSSSFIAISKDRGVVTQSDRPAPPKETSKPEPESWEMSTAVKDRHDTSETTSSADASGFDKAVRYIGEHGAVKLAVVIDHEGLPLGNFNRAQMDIAAWAPMALVLHQSNTDVMARIGMEAPDRINLINDGYRTILARIDAFYLMVIAERQNDDVLGIRISQAIEMIRKCVAERYSQVLSPNAESIHVRSTE